VLSRHNSAQVGAWRVVRSPQGATNGLTGILCPSTRECLAVGEAGVVLVSTDGGLTWRARRGPLERGTGPVYPCPSGFTPPPGAHLPFVCRILVDPTLEGVACPTRKDCLAVGEAGNIVSSADGGLTWQSRPSGSYDALHGIACPTSADCVAVGGNGPDVWVGNGDEVEHSQPATVLTSTDGGAGWKSRASGTGDYTALYGVACPTRKDCLAVGGGTLGGGTILASSDGGTTWQSRLSGSKAVLLDAIACPTSRDCLVVGSGGANGAGTVLASSDGGVTWQSRRSGTDQTLVSITCPTSTDCIVGASVSEFLVSADGGTTWTSGSIGSGQLVGGFACPTTTTCLALGENGAILESPKGFAF
jgi:photosystem II stability/assembly factor-like uncharacterized protein